jgi:hypothetical protein
MPVPSTHSRIPAPPYLPALVAITVLIVLAGLVSLHAGAEPPPAVNALNLWGD